MMIFRTHYDNLKVSREAPMVVINAAYKALCQTYHPDKYQGHKEEAERIFKIIVQSYGVLSDPVKKAEHDRWIEKQLIDQRQGFAYVALNCEERPEKPAGSTTDDYSTSSWKPNDSPDSTCNDQSHFESRFVVGDRGPAGGIIFYVDESGSQGLEAQSTDMEGTFTWSEAMKACTEIGPGWHVPTKQELQLLYQARAIVGGFSNSNYWSSSKTLNANAWTQYFSNGYQYDYNTNLKLLVRAVRSL